MQPDPKKPVVVYRKTPDPTAAASARDPGYAPALAPLIIGFLLLLTVFLVLGLKSANKMTDVSLSARDLNLRHYTQLSRISEMRLKAINLNNEARVRDNTVIHRELKPPLDVRVDRARDEFRAAQELLSGPTPINVEPPEWEQFKANLQAYVEVTEDQPQYNQFGFDRYKKLNDSFESLIPKVENYEKIDEEMVNYQRQAKKTILTWSILAVLVGALVAAGTIWQVQRHFSEMRRSVLETRRERTFTTQLLQGMVSAVAAID